MYAHDPRFPVKNRWMECGEELIEFVEQNADGKVIGIGHSFGATITLNAALLRPDLFHGIILMDPVLRNGWPSILINVLNTLNLTQYITPGHQTKGRQDVWNDLKSARTYFKSKGLFKILDPDCLEDYLKYGLEKTDAGLELKFKVSQEVSIFSQVPTHHSSNKGKLKDLRGLILTGETTNVSLPEFVNRLAKEQDFEVENAKGGHMFPLQHPELTAQSINTFCKSLLS